jgi:sec-independent protein translocase protein TatA
MTLAIFQTVGPLELLIVLGVVLVIFGPKRLPALGRSLGSGMREFKDSISRRHDEDSDDDDAGDSRDRATSALSRPDQVTGEPEPVEGEVVSEKR